MAPSRKSGGAKASTAAALIAPATIFVAIGLLVPLAILFRYSLNEFVPDKKMMVEAVTVANYVKFFTDPYYTSILLTTVRIAVLVTAGLPGRGLSAGLCRSRAPRAAARTC